MKDRLIIKSGLRKRQSCVLKPLMVSEEIFDKVQEICDATDLKKFEIAIKLLTFALDRTEVQLEEDEE